MKILKWIAGIVIALIVLFNIVSDPDVTSWLNYIWIALVVGFIICLFIVAPSDREPKEVRKRNKEG